MNTIARRLTIAGFAAAIACMVGLFITGLVTGSPQMTVIASSTAAALGASMAASFTAIKRKTAKAAA